MAVTNTTTFNRSCVFAGQSGSSAGYATGATQFVFQETLSANQANAEALAVVPHADITYVRILTTQPIDVYVNAPSGGSPAQTFSIPAGGYFEWAQYDVTGAQPFSEDVTALYFTNLAAAPANVQVVILF